MFSAKRWLSGPISEFSQLVKLLKEQVRISRALQEQGGIIRSHVDRTLIFCSFLEVEIFVNKICLYGKKSRDHRMSKIVKPKVSKAIATAIFLIIVYFSAMRARS